MKDITEKAMLVKLAIGQWGARRLDKKATQTVAETYNTTGDVGAYTKRLVTKDRLAGITSTVTAARTYHYRVTLPWIDDGTRILPAILFESYSKAMREYKAQFSAAVQSLCADYPAILDEAKNRLNRLFRAEDYPADGTELNRLYTWDVTILPIPKGSDFRIQLNEEEAAAIQNKIDADVDRAVSGAMKEAWTRLYEQLKGFADKLRNPKAIFRDSLIENLRSLTELLPQLNVTGDDTLDAMAAQVRAEICNYEPDNLRQLPIVRSATVDKADEILTAMSAYMGGLPS